MPQFRVVLVNPKNDGNIGAIARAMGNFDFDDLYLVSPCQITEEAYKRAKHAVNVLENAKVVETLEDALRDCSLVAGTSGVTTPSEKNFMRIPMTPREFAEKTKTSEGRIAILFGREDYGLSQEELMRCDILVHIPASPQYPVLNISHAAAIIFYELFLIGARSFAPTEASEIEKEKLHEFFSDLLDAIGYPQFRKERTQVMFRRLMGRAVPTRWEFYTLMGVIGDAAKKIRSKESDDNEEGN
ncbi:MAG: RNA methyltransferase [Methanomassiliicoccales archaeon]|jgi:TrmH family RNA methyltransferase|nr:RNA methyltransferase [Methanomassiliicoccales archaeon]